MAAPAPPESRLDAAIILLMIMMLAGALAVLAFVAIPHDNLPIFVAIASNGIVAPIAVWTGFRWGSSKSSQEKDQTIATMAKSDNNQ